MWLWLTIANVRSLLYTCGVHYFQCNLYSFHVKSCNLCLTNLCNTKSLATVCHVKLRTSTTLLPHLNLGASIIIKDILPSQLSALQTVSTCFFQLYNRLSGVVVESNLKICTYLAIIIEQFINLHCTIAPWNAKSNFPTLFQVPVVERLPLKYWVLG